MSGYLVTCMVWFALMALLSMVNLVSRRHEGVRQQVSRLVFLVLELLMFGGAFLVLFTKGLM